MIIKSMSRKTVSFNQLLYYMNAGREADDEYYFKHNIYSSDPDLIINEYRDNHNCLKRQKNSNSLYHEIISLKHQKNLSVDEQRGILKDIAEEYTQIRASRNLVYAVIHEQHNQIHTHFMISSNEIESKRNKRLSQKQFNEAKKRIREYAYTKYPLLEQLQEKKKREKGKAKTADKETQLKKRTGKTLDKEQVRDKLSAILQKTQTLNDLINSLRAENFELYERGQTFGFIDNSTGKKYRVKTLGLENEFLAVQSKLVSEKHAKYEKEDSDPMNKHIEETIEEVKLKSHQAMEGVKKEEVIDETKKRTNKVTTEAEIAAQTAKVNETLADRERQLEEEFAGPRAVWKERDQFRQRVYKSSVAKDAEQEKVKETDKGNDNTFKK